MYKYSFNTNIKPYNFYVILMIDKFALFNLTSRFHNNNEYLIKEKVNLINTTNKKSSIINEKFILDEFCQSEAVKIGQDKTFFSKIIKNQKLTNIVKKTQLEVSLNNKIKKEIVSLHKIDKANNIFKDKNNSGVTKSKDTHELVSINNISIHEIQTDHQEEKVLNRNINFSVNHAYFLQELAPDLTLNRHRIKSKIQQFQKLKKSHKINPVTKSWIV